MAETIANSQPTLPRLKAFRTIRERFATMGISPELLTQSHPFNGTILMYLLILGSAITFIGVYIFNYAKTSFEYTQSIYLVSAGILVVVALLILIFEAENLFEYINRCEDMLNDSKYFNFF